MFYFRLLFLFLIFFYFASCSKQTIEKSKIEETNLENQMIEAYSKGLEELKKGDALFAAKKFNEAEILFPQSDVAPRAALMAAYSYYSQNYYADSIAELERFIKIYFNRKDIVYAKYLLALCFYEQIIDEKKDLKSIENSKNIFRNYKRIPQTDFAIDAEFKLNLINDMLLLKKCMGRYYVERKKWIAAINRFKYVVDKYDTTIYVEEVAQIGRNLLYFGLENESKKYANLLGYNYQSSKWYENTYSVFYKNYKKIVIEKQDNVFTKI